MVKFILLFVEEGEKKEHVKKIWGEECPSKRVEMSFHIVWVCVCKGAGRVGCVWVENIYNR